MPHSHETDKDNENERVLTGRHQAIPKDPSMGLPRPTFAAGAVLWRGDRENPASIEVAVIHRPHYDDWSLAKGKLDPGENLIQTAQREISEETGYDIRMSKLLGKVSYPVGDRTKIVWYWTAEVTGGEFVPNDEVDEIRWLPIDQARDLLSYDLDAGVLDKAKKRFDLVVDARVLYVRHGRALQRKTWMGDDNLRPLDKKGRRQAEMLATTLQAFCPDRVYSAEPDRCITTVSPLADELGLPVVVDPLFGDIAWIEQMLSAQNRFQQVVAEGGTSVICGQGTVIPEMIAWLSAKGTLPMEEFPAKKGSVWVLSFSQGQLVGADYVESVLPVK